ncbi:MAG: hypothetical protein K2M46_03715 [Lachnospiraceae bacterium]|nr:hypothetical protein [Lachnospiraceae bacterium]
MHREHKRTISIGIIKDMKKCFWALFLTMVPYLLGGNLIFAIITNGNRRFTDYYEIVASVVNIIVTIITLTVILIFKGYMGKFDLKSFTQGLFVYGLPLVLFMVYHCVVAIKWIFWIMALGIRKNLEIFLLWKYLIVSQQQLRKK